MSELVSPMAVAGSSSRHDLRFCSLSFISRFILDMLNVFFYVHISKAFTCNSATEIC